MAQITRAYQDGKCSVCSEKKPVRVIVEGSNYAGICEKCVQAIGDISISEVVSRYGKKVNKKKSQ